MASTSSVLRKLFPKLYLSVSAHRKYARKPERGEPELRLLPFLVDKNRTAIDIGANKGLYTFYLSKLARKVYAFEPHPEYADFLAEASPSNVTVICRAVADECGEAAFYTPSIDHSLHKNMATLTPKEADASHYEKKTVGVVSLDSLDIEDIGFIKIDIEGAEYRALKGADRSLRKSRPVLLIEILPGSRNRDDVFNYLKELGYISLDLHDGVLRQRESVAGGDGRNHIFIPTE